MSIMFVMVMCTCNTVNPVKVDIYDCLLCHLVTKDTHLSSGQSESSIIRGTF